MSRTKNKTPKSKSTASTTIENTLPGAADIEEPLVDKAVSDINLMYTKKGLETAEAIGAYLLKTFFRNNVANFHEYGAKHATFRALGEHEGLQFSASYLWFAVPVYEQIKFLKENGIAENLPLSHHRMLVAVRDEKKKLTLAQKAIDKGLSKRQFEELVYKNRGTSETTSGRKPLPAFAKGFRKLIQAIDLAVSEDVTKDSFDYFDVDTAEELLGQVDAGLDQLQKLRGKLTKQMDAVKATQE